MYKRQVDLNGRLKVNRYTLRGIDSAFLARLDEVQEELLYCPRHGVSFGVGAGVSKMLKFTLKFLRSHGMMRDIGPKFYLVPSPTWP